MNNIYEFTSKVLFYISEEAREKDLPLNTIHYRIQAAFSIFEAYLKSKRIIEHCVEIHRGWKAFEDNSTGVWDYCYLRFELKLLKRYRRWLIDAKEPLSKRCIDPDAARKLFDSYLVSVNRDLVRLNRELSKY